MRLQSARLDNLAMLSAYGLTEQTLRIDPLGELLSQHREEMTDIVQASGLRPEEAATLLVEPIEAFASYVSRLPATKDAYYSAPAGLLRLGMDCALLTARKAQVWEFSGLGHIERRRIEAPRWRVACILAALLGDLHRAVTQWAVWGDNERWVPLTEPLSHFGERQADRRVRLDWLRGGANADDRSWNLPLVAKIVDDSILDFLNEGDAQIVADFFGVLSGDAVHRPSNVIRPLVEDARARLIARDHASPVDSVQPQAETAAPKTVKVEEAELTRNDTGGIAESLDYPTRLFVKELRRLLARPRSCKGRICLEHGGRLGIRRDWIKTLGFAPAQIEARFIAAGWLERSAAPSMPESAPIFLNERISNELLKDVDRGDLLPTPAPASG